MSAVTPVADGLKIRIYTQPQAIRDQIIRLHDNEIKVSITAAQVNGEANAHLIKFLAKKFKVAKKNIIIEKGKMGRHKLLHIIYPRQIPNVIAEIYII